MQMLTRVKIPEQARKYPGQLSGQQQGLPSPVPGHATQGHALRRADVGLDPEMIKEVLDVMVELARGTTMIVVTPRDGLRPGGGQPGGVHGGRGDRRSRFPRHFFTNPQEERTKLFLSRFSGGLVRR